MQSTELSQLDATAQAELVAKGDVTAAELVEAAIERIDALNPTLNAVITPMYERARAAVRRPSTGPFAGVPFLVKDLALEVKGVRFCEGSRFLRDYVSSFDSELAQRFERAGLIILGKTNTPEFGMAPACEPAAFGATHNPWDLDRSTSGSSGGSAPAVASGMVAMAHANDLGGSIRYPASTCGLFGLKPTRARVPIGPEYGDVVSGWAVEHAVTRSVRDSARLLDATGGPALGDPYCAPAPARPFADEVGRDPGRLRVAFTSRTPAGGLGHPDCVAALDDAVALCASLGHEVIEADLPGLDERTGAAIGTVFSAATSWIVRYWVERVGRDPEPGELDPLTVAYNEMGERVTAGEYLVAIERLQRFGRGVAGFLAPDAGFDVWLTPTMSEPPPPLGEMVSTEEEPLRSMIRSGTTVSYPGVVGNITGNPAMSVPLWWNDDKLPIGVHFLGRFGDEAALLRLAAQLEAARPWANRIPPVHASRLH